MTVTEFVSWLNDPPPATGFGETLRKALEVEGYEITPASVFVCIATIAGEIEIDLRNGRVEAAFRLARSLGLLGAMCAKGHSSDVRNALETGILKGLASRDARP